jgi:hypothetical protein
MKFKYVLALFVLLNVLNGMDAVTTIIGLRLGIGREVNPRAIDMIETWNLLGAMLIKFFLVLGIGAIGIIVYNYDITHYPNEVTIAGRVIISALVFGCLFLSEVVLQNILVLVRGIY